MTDVGIVFVCVLAYDKTLRKEGYQRVLLLSESVAFKCSCFWSIDTDILFYFYLC
jgi:hypothetical protein